MSSSVVRCEHFVYGHFNGVGLKLVKTKGVDNLVNSEVLNMLCRLGNGIKKAMRALMWLPESRVVCISLLEPRTDQYNRKVTWNHTILVPAQEYFDNLIHKILPTFEPYFIRKLNEPVGLEPLMIKS